MEERKIEGSVYRLSLPQVEVTFSRELGRETKARRLIVLGGRAPDLSWLRAVASDKEVWAADRGADVCRAAGIIPARALGDFDSIAPENEEWLVQEGLKLDRYPADKDYTDFQLCLNRSEGALVVTGCWGGRFDHAFANIFSAFWTSPSEKFSVEKVRAFADESEILIPMTGKASLELEFRTRPPVLSLLPLTFQCRGVSVTGTKWELDDALLLQDRPCAVSNVPLNDPVTVKIEEGRLGVYCFFPETRHFSQQRT